MVDCRRARSYLSEVEPEVCRVALSDLGEGGDEVRSYVVLYQLEPTLVVPLEVLHEMGEGSEYWDWGAHTGQWGPAKAPIGRDQRMGVKPDGL